MILAGHKEPVFYIPTGSYFVPFVSLNFRD